VSGALQKWLKFGFSIDAEKFMATPTRMIVSTLARAAGVDLRF
jgi:hypothetical protein